jgi:hypothetical protein
MACAAEGFGFDMSSKEKTGFRLTSRGLIRFAITRRLIMMWLPVWVDR